MVLATIGVAVALGSDPASAEPAPWAPRRFGGAGVIGWRQRGDDHRLDYGGYLSLDVTGALSEGFGSDEPSTSSSASPLNLGLELTAGWLRDGLCLGVGGGLVFW